MNIHKQVITTAVLLMLFATIGAGLVGLIFDNTKETIIENEKLARLKQLNAILPQGSYDNDLLHDTIILNSDKLLGNKKPVTAYRARLNSKPVAIVIPVIAPNGYNGPINMLVGVNVNSTVASVRIVSHRETPGLGDAIDEQRSDWIFSFDNRSLDNPTADRWKVERDGGAFDQFTGATITPRAVVKAVRQALVYFQKNKDQLFINSDTDNEPRTH